MSDEAKVVKVKVSPYPISVTFGTPPTVKRGRIVKLTLRGFLAEIEDPQFTVHDKFECQFTLPVIGTDYKEQVIIVKTYDWVKSKTEKGALLHRLIEFHFKKLGNVSDMEAFLKKIGQVK